jgi:DNA-binding PadR family transcriptional regulator
MKWLRSGLRRDVCVVVAAAGDDPTAQECKAALEDRYGDRVEPKTFYGALDALVDAGHLRERTDGIHDRYALTEAGERALRAQVEWMTAALD